jgi:hypothetical protein
MQAQFKYLFCNTEIYRNSPGNGKICLYIYFQVLSLYFVYVTTFPSDIYLRSSWATGDDHKWIMNFWPTTTRKRTEHLLLFTSLLPKQAHNFNVQVYFLLLLQIIVRHVFKNVYNLYFFFISIFSLTDSTPPFSPSCFRSSTLSLSLYDTKNVEIISWITFLCLLPMHFPI